MDRPCSVLIVEDEPLLQEVFLNVLTAEEFSATVAGDAAAMRAACAGQAFDVIVLDMALPGSAGGMDLAADAAASGAGVILITGHHDLYDTVVKSGFRYLFKPFRVEALVQMIHELLEALNARCTTKRRTRKM